MDWLTEHGRVRGHRVEFSVAYAITEKTHEAVTLIPKKAWTAAASAEGGVREGVDVAELTGLTEGMWIIVRSERLHPGAQASLIERA